MSGPTAGAAARTGRLPAGSTRVAAVIGDPVGHSLSPVLHNAAFQATGLDWVYVALPVAPGAAAEALRAMQALHLGGLSVTMPHKAPVAAALAEPPHALSPAARRLRAVNCVRWDGERLVGENTDGAGLVQALRHEAGIDPGDASVTVLGAGGAARAVALALAEAGAARVSVVNRTAERARDLVDLLEGAGVDVGVVGDDRSVVDADIVINATPVGMGAPAELAALPCAVELLQERQLIVDLVYQPVRTGLLRAADAVGARSLNGVGMLLYQAAVAFELWTGERAPIDAMRGAVEPELGG